MGTFPLGGLLPLVSTQWTAAMRKQRSFVDTRQHTGLDLSGHKRRGH
jgi:hypothetical protein